MLRDWEVQIVRDAKAAGDAAPGAAVVLVDFGTTERGLATAQEIWENGVTLPCLVIGDVEAPAGSRPTMLVRPFTLDDLISAVTSVRDSSGAHPAAPAEEAKPKGEPHESKQAKPEPKSATLSKGPERAAPPSAAPPPKVVAPAPAAERPAAGPGRGTTAATPKVVTPERSAPPPQSPAAKAPTQPSAAPAQASATQARSEAPPRPAPTPPRPVVAEPHRPATARPVEPRGRGLFRRKPATPQRPEERPEDPMARRLRLALGGLQELDALIEELPPLARPRAMAHAFLGEVVELFQPEVAAIYVLANDGTYHAAASHGLSAVESGMKVSPEQPLFLEIASGQEAVLIAPVDLAQGLVAGIGGARTEALLAAPVAVAGACFGVIVVGRKDFSEFDLDVLAELAEEAGPGLAVAQMVERLRSR